MNFVIGQVVKHEYGQDMVVADPDLGNEMVLCMFFEPISGGLRRRAFHQSELHKTLPASTLRALQTILKFKI